MNVGSPSIHSSYPSALPAAVLNTHVIHGEIKNRPGNAIAEFARDVVDIGFHPHRECICGHIADNDLTCSEIDHLP